MENNDEDLKQWVNKCDDGIQRWFETEHKYDLGFPLEAYNGKGKTALNREALPEPYVGDPLAKRKISAVLLRLNPGPIVPEQQLSNSDQESLYNRVREVRNGYSETYRFWRDIPQATHDSWKKFAGWASGLSCSGQSSSLNPEESIVGIDLIPFHSEGYSSGKMKFSKAMSYFQDEIFRIAAKIAKTSHNIVPCQTQSVVLAVGKNHYDICKSIFCKPMACVESDNWEFTLWKYDSGCNIFVARQKKGGGPVPPGRKHDRIIRSILINKSTL